jgi:hypothetical protein
MNSYRHTQLLRSSENRQQKVRVQSFTGHITQHAHAFEAEIENRAIKLL